MPEQRNESSAARTREQELERALNAISGSDGSWNVAAYAQDVLDGEYEEGGDRYLLEPYMVAVALEQLADNLKGTEWASLPHP